MKLNFSGLQAHVGFPSPQKRQKKPVFRHQIGLQTNKYVREQLPNR